jgi:hypothetical protein
VSVTVLSVTLGSDLQCSPAVELLLLLQYSNMFDGTTKRRQQVSLRGKSQEEDKNEFLRRARVERETRARARLEATSAQTVQRFWRGRSTAAQRRQLERQDWDRKMQDLGRLQAILAAAGTVFCPPAPVLMTLVRQLLFFYRQSLDTERFERLCSLLQSALSPTAAAGASAFAELQQTQLPVLMTAWLLRMSRVALLCLQHAAHAHASDAVLDVLQALTAPDSWPGIEHAVRQRCGGALLLRISVPTAVVRQPTADQQQVLQYGLYSLLAQTWQHYAIAASSQQPSRAAKVLCAAALRTLSAALSLPATDSSSSNSSSSGSPNTTAAAATAARLFAAAVLPHGNLLTHPLRHDIVEPLQAGGASGGWWQLLHILQGEQGAVLADSLSPGGIAHTISNLLRAAGDEQGHKPALSRVPPAQIAGFIQLLHTLLQRLPLHLLLAPPDSSTSTAAGASLVYDPMSEDEGEGDEGMVAASGAMKRLDVLVARELARRRGTGSATAGSSSSSSSYSAADVAAAAQTVRQLVDPRVMSRLFDLILPTSSSSSSSSSGDVSAGASLALCALYGDLLMHASTRSEDAAAASLPLVSGAASSSDTQLTMAAVSKSILNSLAFAHTAEPVVARLWAQLERTGGLRAYAASQTSSSRSVQQLGPALHLFCCVYSHTLSMMDDEEFYIKGLPLPLPTLVSLSSVVHFSNACTLHCSELVHGRCTVDSLPCL